MAPDSGRHALVIGGSMAGLLAARVLADHFERVTIVERDRLPHKPEQRQGVPQSRHSHVLLLQGQQILEQLFPGLQAELTAADAPTLDWVLDSRMLGFGGWEPRFPSGLITRTCSRNLLEFTVRRQLATYSNVLFLEEYQVTGLLSDDSQTSVTGVRVRASYRPEKELAADLVIDASGRSSRLPQWLEALGYAPPQETIVNSFLGYASRWYQCPADDQRDWQALVIWPRSPDGSRAGMLYPVEENRWVVTLAGVGRDYPPTDDAGFLDFARNMRSPIIYEAIKDAQPLSPIYSYRRTENRLRHYERLSRWPERLCVMGDAVCAFNPIYGQGMTVSALGALALDQCLNEQYQHQSNRDLSGLAQRFQKKLVKVNATPWLMATGEDFRWPTTEGGQLDLKIRLMHWYLDQVRLLTAQSPQAFKIFMEVLHLQKDPTALFQPSIVLQLLFSKINRRRQDESCILKRDIPNQPSSAVDPIIW